MTISSELIQAGPFNGDDVTTVHPFTMKVLHEGDLSVVRTDANGNKTTLVLTTDYTVSLNSDQDTNPGGSITTTGAYSPLASGETIDIFNEPNFTQLVDLISNGAWNPQVVEGALDRLTILAKRARDRTGLDWRGDWATALHYQIGNLVKHSGNIYYCLIDHTSGIFATDLAGDNWAFWVEQGGIGPAGSTGGVLYKFDSNTTTNTDPGDGDIRLNHSTRASVTEIAISDKTADSGNPDIGAYLASFDANASSGVRGYIYIKKVADPSKLSIYSITGASIDGGSYWRLAVTHVASVGTIDNADPVAIEFNSTFNLGVISQVDAEAGTATDNKIFTAERVKQAIDKLGSNGRQTAVFSAAGIRPAITNGPAWTESETSSHKRMFDRLLFDKDTEEFGHWNTFMPKSYSGGNIYLIPVWTHEAATSFGVAWGFEAKAIGDGDNLDSSWGTEVVTTDTGGTTDDLYYGSEVEVTPGGTPAGEKYIFFRVTRVVGNVNDTLNIDAGLVAVIMLYPVNNGNDD